MAGRAGGSDEARARGKGAGRLLAGVALVVLAGFVAAVWYAYDQGVKQGATITPPLIKADTGPTKVRPNDPGGLVVPDQDKLIYRAIEGESEPQRVERLLPPPEEPVARPRAEPGDAVTVGELHAVPPGEAPSAPGSSAPAASLPPPLPAEHTAPTATPPAPAPQVTATAPAAPAVPKPPPAPPDSGGNDYRIQLAAYRDPEAATAGWARISRANPKLLGPLSPTVIKADLGPGKGIFYRLLAGPIADKDAAEALCQELKLKQVGCLVVAQ